MNEQKTFRAQQPNVELAMAQLSENRHPIALVLDQLNDVRNLGFLLRLADAARLEKVWLYKMEAFPEKKLKRFSRTAHQYVPMAHLKCLDDLESLRQTHQLLALEITAASVAYTDFQPQFPSLLVVGSEQRGISQEVLDLVDGTVHIPMYGLNLSMNVAMAAGIVVYHFLTYLHHKVNV
ncbi:MAG: TrmH family RNA methyltransferase [Saprospiraceae bacterium]|nr:TrmH family RNA methyltransferase [Saprospiraceae bacterium]